MIRLRVRAAAWSLALIPLVAGCGPDASPEANEPPPFPGSAATTAWRAAEDPPEGFGLGGDRFASPFATLQALMTFGVQQDDGLPEGQRLVGDVLEVRDSSARAWMHLIGSSDDSVAGQEIILLMARDARGWFIERLTWRDHCRRAVDQARAACL